MFVTQKLLLKALLPTFMLNQKGIILAGGAITSIFMRKEINDYDFFCKNQTSFDSICDELLKNGFGVIFVSNKAITFTKEKIKIQIMHYSFFENCEEVYKHFDFSACMGGFDFDVDDFVLDDKFLLSLASRNTSININTKYPIITMLRVPKYEEKGFTIHKSKKLALMLKVLDMKIDSWEQLEDQLGGFYGGLGINDDDKNTPFSMDVAITKAHSFAEVKNIYEKKTFSSEDEFIKKTGVSHKKVIAHLQENGLIQDELEVNFLI